MNNRRIYKESNGITGNITVKKRVNLFSVLPAVMIISVALVFSNQTASAQNANKQGVAMSSQPKWIYPVIHNAGGVHPRPDLPMRPNSSANYNIFVDIVSTTRDSSGQYEGLERLARLVNLMAYTNVPTDHVHIAALFDGKSGYATANNTLYQQLFKTNNPNLSIIHALKKAGVKLMVCSQALAEFNLPDNVVDPDVTITLSALTDVVIYGQRGYIYMQL